MKQNITLSVDNELIKKAKMIAVHRQTSISGMLSEELRKIVEDTEKYQLAKRRAIENLRKGFHLGGSAKHSREELHER